MTGTRFLNGVSRRALATLGAALAVTFLALTPGTASAGDGDRQITKLRITILTADDNLRQASRAVAALKYENAYGEVLSAGGHLNNAAEWPNWSSRTVDILMPTGVVLSRLHEFSIQFTSGQPDIFSTGDNWNMASVLVVGILDDESELVLVNQANSPYLHRFKSDAFTRWATPL
ncbi:hypothetical protein [Pyxidicoccus xibeiensis]|uniref:hypothetical protein n=1 Tax=Pyxidicoccus xibeiensis TaxID=2906759 RepID=UPI0020A6F4E2|nr:hypothetical protein [Pyxidicoccus xibeiensis]MCP3135959.1 hypothetical protein [Pyxidicoccus xibeiensis]